MNLRARFLLIIVTITFVCIVGVSVSLIHDLSNFWLGETEKKIQENRIGFESRLNQVKQTSISAAKIISESQLIARYFAMSKSDRYILLSPSLARYLDVILKSFPFFQEITLIIDDGFEDARAANGVVNKNEYDESDVVLAARNNPQKSFHAFEYHMDFDAYSFNTYRAIEVINRNKSAREKEVTAVVKISVGVRYLAEVYDQNMGTANSFIVIHNTQGNVAMKGGAALPEALSRWLLHAEINDLETLKDQSILVTNTTLLGEWNLLVGVSSVEAFESINFIMVRGVVIQLIFFLFLAVCMLFMLSRFVVSPLQGLVAASNSFYKTGKIPIFKYRKDEIGVLQDAFMIMGAKVSRQTRSLEEQVYIDSLTGLPNRKALNDLLDLSIRAADIQKKKVALMFIDLDGFKQVNDVLGHEAGDALLKLVAKRLSSFLRSGDVLGRLSDAKKSGEVDLNNVRSVVRLGGDEFTVILQDVSSSYNVEKVAEKIILLFNDPFVFDDKEIFVGASIGVSIYPDDSTNPSDLLKYADTAMYSAKSAGKMRAEFFNADMFKQTKARLNIDNVLHRAFSDKLFWVAYQPKVDPVLRRVVGFEALARLRCPKFGDVSPKSFIPLAEKNGLLNEISHFVLKDMCQQFSVLKRSSGRHFSMSLNLSFTQFSNREFCLELLEIIRHENIQPKYIEFELTNNSVIDQDGLIEKNIQVFKKHGVGVALDDFGVGYSSLVSLQRFKFDVLKLDQSFFKTIGNDNFCSDILESVSELSKTRGMLVVAEGIETEEQLNVVQRIGVDLVQGDYFSLPENASELLRIIQKIELS